MLKNLRNRLFASYLLVLVIALLLVASVTVTQISQREVPREFTWNRLELLLTGFTSQQFVRETLVADAGEGTVADRLGDFAESNNVRVILVVRNRDEEQVLYDSLGEFQIDNTPEFDPEDNRSSQRGSQAPPSQRIRFGSFYVDDDNYKDEEWLYAAFGLDINTRPRIDDLTLYIAEPRSTESVRAIVTEFNDLIFLPLMRSAIIGGVIAFILAIFLTRSITKPLQALAKSAQYVAKGEFSEEVPVTGPAEIQQVAVAFNRMTGEVRATQQAQREFMANVSHDLKTPLTSIQGYSQAIMDGAASNPADAAEIIHDEAERLNRMVQELTDLARLQAGRLSMKLSPLDISAVVSSISERLAMVAKRQKNIDLTVETHPTPIISADGDRMVQVLNNLIGNAIKYTPNNGTIRVMTGVRNGGVEIIVQDNGIGIPTDDLPHIFDRFYQVDKSRGPTRGTGLGLAITQEIVQGHGGTIHIFSNGVNQGTSVTVWLPSPNMSTITMRRVTAE
ncbi:MAG: HAMP domain-containing sensor histidine kinase [Chloroflexota bacterium]